jgi:DNA-directed RNA polymerase specialized sigma24 family protein
MHEVADEREEARLCERFLRLAQQEPFSMAFSVALGEVHPLVVRTASRVVGPSRSADFAIETQDVVQAVLVKLASRPPSEGPGAEPRRRLLTWVRIAALNQLRDLHRRATVRKDSGDRTARKVNLSKVEEVPRMLHDKAPGPEERVADADCVKRFVAFLDERYPRGAELVRAMQRLGDSDDRELACELQTSIDNIYQIKRRVRVWSVRFLDRGAS